MNSLKKCSRNQYRVFCIFKNDIEDAIEKFAALSEVMDKVTGEPQPTSNIKQALEVSLAAVNHVAADKLEAAQIALDKANAEPEEEVVEDEIEVDSAQPKKRVSDEIDSRENAIKNFKKLRHFSERLNLIHQCLTR
nr:hypothetical protein [Ningiella sp. W23]